MTGSVVDLKNLDFQSLELMSRVEFVSRILARVGKYQDKWVILGVKQDRCEGVDQGRGRVVDQRNVRRF